MLMLENIQKYFSTVQNTIIKAVSLPQTHQYNVSARGPVESFAPGSNLEVAPLATGLIGYSLGTTA